MRKRAKSLWIVSLLIFQSFSFFSVLESPQVEAGIVIYVGSGPANHSKTINGGIVLASNGDTVYVHSGTYHENVVVDKTINLTGEYRDTTIIDGENSEPVVKISADSANVTGFTITSLGASETTAGMRVDSDGNAIYGNHITDNLNGIELADSSGNTISNNLIDNSMAGGMALDNSSQNKITNNTVEFSNPGLFMDFSTGNVIAGNGLFNNSMGISMQYSSGNTIWNNTCSFNGGNGMLLTGSSQNDFIGNVVSFNGPPPGPPQWPPNPAGIFIMGGMVNSDRNNFFENIVSGSIYGIFLDFGNANNFTKNVVSNCFYGIILNSSVGNNLRENEVFSNFDNIFLHFNLFASITGNKAYNGTYGGIHLFSSNRSVISDNVVFNNQFGIYLDGYQHNNTVADNEVSTNLIGVSVSGKSLDNIITNNSITSNDYDGLWIEFHTDRTLVAENRISDNLVGINVTRWSNDNRIIANDVSSNRRDGVAIDASEGNQVLDNTINGNINGIILGSSSRFNLISSNYVSFNAGEGIRIENLSSNTTIMNNYISSNGGGVNISDSSDNLVHHNNFISNINQSFDDTDLNRWNDSYPSGGNFWSDWSTICQDLYDGAVTPQTGGGGSDAVCDLQYDVDADSADYYPLAQTADTTPPMIYNLQPPDGSTMSDSAPAMGASYWDLSGIDAGSVLLKVDGIDVTPWAVVTSTDVAYQPSLPLLNGPHQVYLEVSDNQGNLAYASWSFTVALIPITPYITGLRAMDSEVNITWSLSPSLNVNAYDVYGGPAQTSIDFGAPLFSTPDESVPAQQWWAQFPFDTAGNREYYFVVRARDNALADRSITSNTAGYYRIDFGTGLNAFSLPLEPLAPQSLDGLMAQMGASSISWQDANDDWRTYLPNWAPAAETGQGYVVDMPAPLSYVFTGEPAAMVMYDDGFGFDADARDDLAASVDILGDVTLSWTSLAGADRYRVLRSASRDGFHMGSYSSFEVSAPPFVDVGAASIAGELYYIVVPNSDAQGDGASTYSIGIITAEFNGNHMFGLPLKPVWGGMSADWYVDAIVNCLGIVYLENGNWEPHFREFPEGVYDTTVVLGVGYEITVFSTTRFTYVGW